MVEYTSNGVFRGRVLISASSSTGGVRDVFYKYKGIKNDLVEFPFGGQVMNPYRGIGKMFAGDLCEYRVDDRAENPQIWLLKTYEVVSASGSTVNIARDGFRHQPHIGDVLTVAPDSIGGTGTAMTVVAVKKTKVDSTDVWELTLSSAPSSVPTKGDILVECDDSGEMLVQNINAVLPTDFDFCFSPALPPENGEDDFETARYLLTPTMGGVMYKHKMSPMPKCVEAFNRVNINGVFGFHAITMGTND